MDRRIMVRRGGTVRIIVSGPVEIYAMPAGGPLMLVDDGADAAIEIRDVPAALSNGAHQACMECGHTLPGHFWRCSQSDGRAEHAD